MSGEMRCPSCGESERLAGTRLGSDIEVTCGSCDHRWLRGSPRCRACGGEDVVTRLRLMTRHPRGNQLAVVGHREVPLCPRCDVEVVDEGGRLVPEGYVSRFLFGVDDPRPVRPTRHTTPASRPATRGSDPRSARAPRTPPRATPPPSKEPGPSTRPGAPTVRQAIEAFLSSVPAADAFTMVMLGQHLGPATRLDALTDRSAQESLQSWFTATWGGQPDARRAVAAAAVLAAVDHWREQGWLSDDPVGWLR